MSFEQSVILMSPLEIEQELLVSKKPILTYIKEDIRLKELDKTTYFSTILQKEKLNNKSFQLTVDNNLDLPIKDENNVPYRVFKAITKIYKNSLNDDVIKQVYQLTVTNKDASIVTLDNETYVTKGIVITVSVFSENKGELVARNKLIQSLLNTSMSKIPYIKGPFNLGVFSLKNTNFDIDRDWTVLWVSSNIFVKAESDGIPEEKVIEICQWIESYIK